MLKEIDCHRIWRAQGRRSAGSRHCCGKGRELISDRPIVNDSLMKIKWLLGFDVSILQYFQTLKSTRMKVKPLKVPFVVSVKNPLVY